jgi:predicted nucleotidyltransferase
MESSISNNPILVLESQIGVKWPAIARAASDASEVRKKLEILAEGVTTTDAALCVFGSLARKEWTAKSDIDWTLLIDGQADPQHLELSHKIAARFQERGFGEPGKTGLFGSMAFVTT